MPFPPMVTPWPWAPPHPMPSVLSGKRLTALPPFARLTNWQQGEGVRLSAAPRTKPMSKRFMRSDSIAIPVCVLKCSLDKSRRAARPPPVRKRPCWCRPIALDLSTEPRCRPAKAVGVPGLLPPVFASLRTSTPGERGFALPHGHSVAMGPPTPNALGLEWKKTHRTAPVRAADELAARREVFGCPPHPEQNPCQRGS